MKDDVPGFGYYNRETRRYEGMEIDLAKLIAKEFTGDENKIQFTPVTPKTRGLLLDSGDVDMVIATFTITEERKLLHNFSRSYYTDSIGIMVRVDSGIRSLADLHGKTIGVVEHTPTKNELQADISISEVDITFKQYPTAADAKAALVAGQADAFSIGCSILNGYLDDDSMILPERYSPQRIGIATKKSNTALADSVDSLVRKWLNDGTIASLADKYNLGLLVRQDTENSYSRGR